GIDRGDYFAADAGPAEYGLDDDRAAEEIADLQPDGGHDRQQRVPQHMRIHDPALAQPLGPRAADEILLHVVEHGGARDAHVPGDREGGQRDAGQDEMLPATSPGDRQPLQVDAEEQDQQDAEPEARDRLSDQSHDRHAIVEEAVRPRGGDHAERDGEHDRDD